MKRNFLFLFIMVAILAGCAKVVVLPLSSNLDPPSTASTSKLAAEGVFYALPKTVVRIDVKVNHTVPKAAPFMSFAAIFVPDGQPVCKNPKCIGEGDRAKFELQEGVSFSTFGEPDPAHVYMVKFAGGGAIDQSLSMTWNDAGLPSTVSASVTNRTADVVVSGLKLAAGLGTKLTYGAAVVGKKKVAEKEIPVCPDKPSDNDAWIIPRLQKVTDTLVVNYCDMDLKDRDSFNKERDEAQLDLASQAYDNHVLALAKAREALLMGGKQTMEPAELVSKLETLISQRLKDLYLGSKKTETWEGSLDIRNLEVGKEIPILNIDPEAGICIGAAAELAPNSKPLKPLEGDACKKASPISMMLGYYPIEDSQLFKVVRSNTIEPSGDRSFRYRIPAQVLAKIKDTNKTYGVAVFSVAQLGTVASLPARRHSKSMSYDLSFMEATGGLKSFKLGTTGGLDAATVDALSGIGGTVVDARNTARKAEQTANDELTVLTKQDSLLKLKDEICQIQMKYGLPCTVQP